MRPSVLFGSFNDVSNMRAFRVGIGIGIGDEDDDV
jgi:hypothetical protein